ncbi:Gastrula zinc finger [Paramuricea clavata]|uniref:Gastrula zinc finger n=1 Tax=Paramuricea clavata TaxID=317549 RepID=A0A7D9JU05_PARCT|nr:Gastrula zinc finger [Paramuricea clavata]
MELLLLGDNNGNNHYVLIKDVNRMLFSVSKHAHRQHFCLHCLHSCVSEESLEKHKETCLATKFPEEGTTIKFKHQRNSMPVPFVIYADFESILVLVPEEKKEKSDASDDSSSPSCYQKHKACSFGLKTVCHYDNQYFGEYKSYVGEDAALVFLKTVIKESTKCRELVNKIFKKKLVITPEQELEFWTTRNCSICGNDLVDDRVRDHDHVTGLYRGAAHKICNLKYRITWEIPVVFHKLRGYDSHLIMQEIGKFRMNVNLIPNNMEKYISFSLGKNLVFIDSIQFMASSLESLVDNLSPEDFKIVGERWKGEDFNLVTQKGVFPYEFLDDISILITEGLQSKDKFYSTLYESEVSDKDYERAQKVWDHFKMKTLKDYHDLYLETDVLLLADVFENFRRTCLKNYELDPAHYVSAPSLSWDAFLKKSGEEIELLVSSKDQLLKLTASPSFQSHRIMNEHLIVVKKIKEVLTLNKPCYVGMSILDLSKTLMYDFHYNTIKKEYGNKSKLLFTDTDSLMYELKTKDVYEDFKKIGEKLNCWDNSDYPKDSPYYSTHNKKVIGKFKDEAGGVPIIEFVGLRSKMYSYVKENGKGGMTAKGVKKYVIRNKLSHENFKNVINTKSRMRHSMNTIRSTKHTIGTYEVKKVTLSCFDDKRYLLEDGVTSYAYGHCMIEKSSVDVPIEEKINTACVFTRAELEIEECKLAKAELVVVEKPKCSVKFPEEIVRMKTALTEKLQERDVFLDLIVEFRKAERTLSHHKRTILLMLSSWDIDKAKKYVRNCDNKKLCEMSDDEIQLHWDKLVKKGMTDYEVSLIISREVYEGGERLKGEYRFYLGLTDEYVEKPSKLYKDWLMEVMGYNEKTAHKLTAKEFNGEMKDVAEDSDYEREMYKKWLMKDKGYSEEDAEDMTEQHFQIMEEENETEDWSTGEGIKNDGVTIAMIMMIGEVNCVEKWWL